MDQPAERPQQDKQQTDQLQPSPSQKPADPVIRRGTGISREDAQRGTAVPGETAQAAVPAALIGSQA
jgi:hypothetical protein